MLLFLSFWRGGVVLVSGVGSFPCLCACAERGICSGVLVLGFLWVTLVLATYPAVGVLAWCGSSVFVFRVVVVSFLFGPGLPVFLVLFPLGPDDGAVVPLS